MSLNKKQLLKDTKFANSQRKAPAGNVKRNVPIIGPGAMGFQKPTLNQFNYGGAGDPPPHQMSGVVEKAKELTPGKSFQDAYTDIYANTDVFQKGMSDYANAVAYFGSPGKNMTYVRNPQSGMFENVIVPGNVRGYSPDYMGYKRIKESQWENRFNQNNPTRLKFHAGGPFDPPHPLHHSGQQRPTIQNGSPDSRFQNQMQMLQPTGAPIQEVPQGDPNANLPDYAGQSFIGDTQARRQLAEHLKEPDATVVKANALRKKEQQEQEKEQRILADKVQAVQSGDIEGYYADVKDTDRREKLIDDATEIRDWGLPGQQRPNGPWNNWGDGPVGHVAIVPWLLGGKAIGAIGEAAIGRIAASNIGRATGAAWNNPLVRSIPGSSAGNLMEAGFAADFLVNRAPIVAQDVYTGEADWDTAITAGEGLLDLVGAGVTGGIYKQAGKMIPHWMKKSKINEAGQAVTDLEASIKIVNKEKKLTQEKLNSLYKDNNALQLELDMQIRNLQDKRFQQVHKEAEGYDIKLNSGRIEPRVNQPRGEYMKAHQEAESARKKSFALKELKNFIDSGDVKILPDGSIEAKTKGIYEQLGTMKSTLSPEDADKGVDKIVHFGTGDIVPINIEAPGTTRKYYLTSDEFGYLRVAEDVTKGTSDYTVNKEYWAVLDSNVKTIENEWLPGSKVYGSTRFGEIGTPHASSDFDVFVTREDYDNFDFSNKDLWEHNPSGKKALYGPNVRPKDKANFGKSAFIDVNVIDQNPETGMAKGGLAVELYRQFYPDRFYQEQERVLKGLLDQGIDIRSLSKEDIQDMMRIDVTPRQMLDNMDPTTKSIIDAYETTDVKRVGSGSTKLPTKEKQVNRIDYLIETGDPNKVAEGQRLYAESILGSDASLGIDFQSKGMLNDVEENLKLLNEYAPHYADKKRIANDPKKMQLVLNDIYLDKSVITRQIWIDSKHIKNFDDLKSAFTRWRSTADNGGEGMGWGLNAIQGPGEPGWQTKANDLTGNIQFNLINDENQYSSVSEYLKDLDSKVSGSTILDDVQKGIVKKIADKYEIPIDEDKLKSEKFSLGHLIEGRTYNYIGNELSVDQRRTDYLAEVGKELGVVSIQKGNFGIDEKYTSVIKDFDDKLDNLKIALNAVVPSLKSKSRRESNIKQAFKASGTLPKMPEGLLTGFKRKDWKPDSPTYTEASVQFKLYQQLLTMDNYVDGQIQGIDRKIQEAEELVTANMNIMRSYVPQRGVASQGKSPFNPSYDPGEGILYKLRDKKEQEFQPEYEVKMTELKKIEEQLKDEITNLYQLRTKAIDRKVELEKKHKEFKSYLTFGAAIGVGGPAAAFGTKALTDYISENSEERREGSISFWETEAAKLQQLKTDNPKAFTEKNQKSLDFILEKLNQRNSQNKKYKLGGMVIGPGKVMITKPQFEDGGKTPKTRRKKTLAELQMEKWGKDPDPKTLGSQAVSESTKPKLGAVLDERGKAIARTPEKTTTAEEDAEIEKRIRYETELRKPKTVSEEMELRNELLPHYTQALINERASQMRGLTDEQYDELYGQSWYGRAYDIATNPFDAFKYSVQTGDFRNMPKNYSVYEDALAQTGESDPYGVDWNPIGTGAEIAYWAAPTGWINTYKGIKNLPSNTRSAYNAAKSYIGDVRDVSRMKGKFSLPKYKNVYRVEHADFNMPASGQDITGRWFLQDPVPNTLDFYSTNLKQPGTEKVLKYFRGEKAPVRIMRQRIPEHKASKYFGAGMPEEARLMSYGVGDLSSAQYDELMGAGAYERWIGGKMTARDAFGQQTMPALFNPTEGIMPADMVNKIRFGQNKDVLGFARGKSKILEDQSKAYDFMRDVIYPNVANQGKGLESYLPISRTFDYGGQPHPHDEYGSHYSGTAGLNSGSAFFQSPKASVYDALAGSAFKDNQKKFKKAEEDLGPTAAKAKATEAEKNAANRVLNTDDKSLLQKATQPWLENLSNMNTSEGYYTPTGEIANALLGRKRFGNWEVGSPGGAEGAALSAYFNVHPERVNKYFEASNYLPNAVQPKGFYEAHGDTIYGDFPSFVNTYLRDPLYANEQATKILRKEYPTNVANALGVKSMDDVLAGPSIPFAPKMTKEQFKKDIAQRTKRDQIYKMIEQGKPWDDMLLGRYSVQPGFDPRLGLNYMQYRDVNDYDTHWLGNIVDKTVGSPFDIAGRVYYQQQVNPTGDTINVKVPERMVNLQRKGYWE